VVTPYSKLTSVASLVVAVLLVGAVLVAAAGAAADDVTQGSLMVLSKPGQRLLQFPLEHTSVEAEITGLVARVEVTQEFGNPYGEPIEAVYVFPLPENSAVSDMTMKIGDRSIRAEIQTREQARETYEAAKAAGQRASLLEQERPNIFTQSVANIMPGDKILITITYSQDLKYDHGTYEYVFPMVVGPRFIPGAALPDPQKGLGWSPDTTTVPDASKITPPVLRPDERSGHDIALHVKLNAGVPIRGLRCISHNTQSEVIDALSADVRLSPGDSIPNKDFILRYDVGGDAPESAIMPYHGSQGGYFLLMIQPKTNVEPGEVTPKEMVFVMDCSGSMQGAPIEKSKEAAKRCIKGVNKKDTFQVITFSLDAGKFRDAPVPATPESIAAACEFIDGLSGEGGTMMIKGIEAALDYPRDPERMRTVFFMTDGYIGNEAEILAAIDAKLGGSRLFSLGVGSSVNRYLLDSMAKVGRGTVEYVRQDEDTEQVVTRFYERIANPYLTDIEIEADGVTLEDLYPARIPDLFSAQPVIVHGRYAEAGEGRIRVTGKIAGKPWSTVIPVKLPGGESGNPALAGLWARQKMADLMGTMYPGPNEDTVGEITSLAIEFRLMSPYTSFVAVEDKVVNENGVVKTVAVPVPIPEGVSYEGVFGDSGVHEVNALAVAGKGGYAGGGYGGGLAGGGYGGGTRAYGSGVASSGPPTFPAGPVGQQGLGARAPRALEVLGLSAVLDILIRGEDLYSSDVPFSWAAVLRERPPAEAPKALRGVVTAAMAARQFVNVPDDAPQYLSSAGLSVPAAQDSALKCLIIPAAEAGAENLPARLAELPSLLDKGLFLLLDGQDEAFLAAVLASDGRLKVVDLPADHAIYAAAGTLYDVAAHEVKGIELDGKLVGLALPGTLAKLAEGISDGNMDDAKLAMNVLSYVLSR